jgi:Ni,Fe-hydrogenase I cytochrome b subunit
MQLRKPLSLLQNMKKRIMYNERLKFLLFLEKTPKHRVMQNISPVFLSLLSLSAFLAGIAGFAILAKYGFVGFVLYYFAVIISVLELPHCFFDR